MSFDPQNVEKYDDTEGDLDGCSALYVKSSDYDRLLAAYLTQQKLLLGCEIYADLKENTVYLLSAKEV